MREGCVPAVIVAVIAKNSDAHTGDTLDEYLNILQSIQLPFALLPILHFTSSRRIMGAEFVNGGKFKIFGWCVVTGIIIINFYLVVSQILDFSVSGLPDQPWMYVIIVVILIAYVVLIVFIVWNDLAYALAWVRKRGGWDRDPSMDGLEHDYDRPAKGSPAWIEEQKRSDAEMDGGAADGLTQRRGRRHSGADGEAFLPGGTPPLDAHDVGTSPSHYIKLTQQQQPRRDAPTPPEDLYPEEL